jgi:hypothetical protein
LSLYEKLEISVLRPGRGYVSYHITRQSNNDFKAGTLIKSRVPSRSRTNATKKE